MSIPTCNSRLPDRLPVGATYVVEGFGGDEGNFRVVARYIVLPGGRRINVPADLSGPAGPRVLTLRRRTNTKKSGPKTRAASRSKKIAARRGTG
jgi:hypothetical protein